MYRKSLITGLAVVLLSWMTPASRGQDVPMERNVGMAVPSLSVETSVPAEINIGSQAQFVISVKNTGKSVAEGVSIQTTLPASVKFVQADPLPRLNADRALQFEIGDIPPGTVRRVVVDLIPQKTGPVDLQTRAYFSASAQSALQVRRPEITIRCQGPETAPIGSRVTFKVVVKNIGDGPAREVSLTPEIPEASYLQEQTPRAAKIPLLPAGESKEFAFVATAVQKEWLEANFVATATDNKDVECGCRVRILHPDLKVQLDGPRINFREANGDYEIRVWNPGDMVLEGVRVSLHVPEGLEVTTLSEEAAVDQESRVYSWCIPRLNPNESHTIRLRATLAGLGHHLQEVVAVAEGDLQATDKHLTHVIARADVDVAVVNTKEAIEVGREEGFSVSLINRGSQATERVSVVVQLPDSFVAVPSDAYETEGATLRFPNLRLNPAEAKSLQFRVVGMAAGEHTVRAIVQTDFAAGPITAETQVYFYDEAELQRIASQLDETIQRH